MNARWKDIVLWSVSGVLTGTSLLVPYGFTLAVFGLMLVLYMLLYGESSKSVFLGVLLSGTLHMLVVLSWGFSLEPLTALGLSQFAQLVFLTFVVGTSALVIALGVAVALATLHFVTVGQGPWRLWLFPAALLLGEIIGRLFFALYTIGPSGGLAPAFGFGHLGFSLASHGLLVLGAKFGGVYMLTLIVALLATVAVRFREYRSYLFVGLFVLMVTACIRVPSALPRPLAAVGLVETTVSLKERLLTFKRDVTLPEQVVAKAVSEGLSTIILPEDSRYFEASSLHASYMSQSIAIVDSERVDAAVGAVLKAAVIKHGVLHEAGEKQYIVSFGEYVPLFHAWLFSKLGFGEVVKTMQDSFGYRTGSGASVDSLEGIPAVLFCYESAVPYALYAKLRGREVPYVAHIVSHAWFADDAGLLKAELRSMLKVQAVANGVYILQSANKAPAAVYTPYGMVYEARRTSDDWQVYRVGDLVSGGESLVY